MLKVDIRKDINNQTDDCRLARLRSPIYGPSAREICLIDCEAVVCDTQISTVGKENPDYV